MARILQDKKAVTFKIKKYYLSDSDKDNGKRNNGVSRAYYNFK